MPAKEAMIEGGRSAEVAGWQKVETAQLLPEILWRDATDTADAGDMMMEL